jgi:hypothetical protein
MAFKGLATVSGNHRKECIGRGHCNVMGNAVALARAGGEQHGSRERQERVHSHAPP